MASSMKQVLIQQNDPKLLLLPKINEHLIQHGNEKFSAPAMEKVWGALTTPPRNRVASFSSSSSGVDLRHQELAYLGYPQTQTVMPDLQVIFTIGHWLHAMTQGLLLTAGLIQDIEVPAQSPEHYTKGSMDGEGFVWWDTINPAWRGQPFLLEAKTVGQWAWDKKVKLGRPSDDHLAQIHKYMWLTGIRLCSYLMLNKGGGGDAMVEFVVEADPKLLQAAQDEMEALKLAVDTQTLHAQSGECRLGLKGACPYGGKSGYCSSVTKWEPYSAS